MKKYLFFTIISLVINFNSFSGIKENQLFLSVKVNDLKKVKELISKGGVDINAVDKSTGKTSLMISISKKNYEIIKLLVESGANVNLKDKKGNTALHYACNYKLYVYPDSDASTDLEIQEKEIKTKVKIITDQYINIINYLIEKEADINSKNNKGNIPLLEHFESSHKSTDIFDLFLKYNKDINVANNEKNSGLILAAQSKDLDIIKLFHKNGADINHVNIYGSNALMEFIFFSGVQNEEKKIKELMEGINYFIDNNIDLTQKRDPITLLKKEGDKIDIIGVAELTKNLYLSSFLGSGGIIGYAIGSGIAEKHYVPIIYYLKKKQKEYINKNAIK